MMKFYTGVSRPLELTRDQAGLLILFQNYTGQNPGNLPSPYFWWEGWRDVRGYGGLLVLYQ